MMINYYSTIRRHLTKQAGSLTRTILVSGHSGSGKSTLAEQLAARLRQPLVSLDKHPAWHDLFRSDPESLHLIKGTPERKNFLAIRKMIANDALNSLKEPTIVEGTQLAGLPFKDLARFARVYVSTPLRQLLDQRIARVEAKALAKQKPWDASIRQRRYDMGRRIYDDNYRSMLRFKNMPDTVLYRTRQDVPEDVLNKIQKQSNAYVFSRLDDPGDGTEQDLRKRYDVHLDDKNVAYLVYRPESFEKDGPFLSGLYVSPEHRRQGLAKKLVTMLEREHKGETIRLLASPYKDKNMTTQELVAMYKHLGFKSDNAKRPARMSKQAAVNIVELLKQKGINITEPAQDPTKRGIFGQLRRSFAERFKPISNPVNISTLLPELGKPSPLFQPNQLFRRPFEPHVEKAAISTNAIMRAAQKAKSRGVPAERLQKYWNTFDGWSEEANKRYWNSFWNEVKNNSWQKSNWFSALTDMFKRRKAKKSVITQLKQRGVTDPGDIGMHIERKTSYPIYSHRYAADLDPADNLPEQARAVRDIFAPFNWDTLFHEAGHAVDFGTPLKPNMGRTALSPLGPPTKREYWKAYREQLALDNPLSDVFTDHGSTLRREANAWRFGNQMMRDLDLARNRRMREIGTSTYELNLLREMRKNLNNNSATELQSSMPFLPAKFRRALDTMPGSTTENLIPQKQASTKDNSVLRSLIQAKSYSDKKTTKTSTELFLI